MKDVEGPRAFTSGLPAQRDLSKGVIVVLSGGPFDWMNPIEVRNRMDQIISDVNADPWVLANTEGKGLIFRVFEGQETNHIHQARWKELCESPALLAASPLVIIGHSNGGAAAMDLARYLQDKQKWVDFFVHGGFRAHTGRQRRSLPASVQCEAQPQLLFRSCVSDLVNRAISIWPEELSPRG